MTDRAKDRLREIIAEAYVCQHCLGDDICSLCIEAAIKKGYELGRADENRAWAESVRKYAPLDTDTQHCDHKKMAKDIGSRLSGTGEGKA